MLRLRTLGTSLVIIVARAAWHNFGLIQREREPTNVDLDDDENEPEKPSGTTDATRNAKRQLLSIAILRKHLTICISELRLLSAVELQLV